MGAVWQPSPAAAARAPQSSHPLPPRRPRGRVPPVVRREETSPKGDGSIRRYFCGEVAAAEKEAAVAAAADDGEAAAEVGADNGAHRLRFGDAGLSSGSKSRVRFRVAPHAMAGVSGSCRVGKGRTREGGQSGAPKRA